MAQVKVGMARIPLTSCGAREGWTVHDELMAGAAWLDDGRQPVALVTLDHVEMSGADVGVLKTEIEKRIGLAPERVVVTCSHTHSGMSLDTAKLGALVGDLLREAKAAAEPAWLAFVRTVNGRRYSVNRRVKAGDLGTFTITYQRGTKVSVANSTVDARGQIEDFINYAANLYTPNYADKGVPERVAPTSPAADVCLDELPPELFLDGPVDPHLEALCFQRRDGSSLGTIVRAASHPVIFRGSHTRQFSADYPGVLTREIARATSAPALFVNGPCGNTKPIVIDYGAVETERFGLALAREILTELPGCPAQPLERLTWIRLHEQFPVTADMRNVSQADFEKAVIAYNTMAAGPYDPVELKRKLDQFIHVWSGTFYKLRDESIDLPFTLLGLNDTALAFLPGEIFAELSLDIKERFPERRIVIAELADSADPGYVPVRAAFSGGGYEPNGATLPAGSGEQMADIMSKMLRLFFHMSEEKKARRHPKVRTTKYEVRTKDQESTKAPSKKKKAPQKKVQGKKKSGKTKKIKKAVIKKQKGKSAARAKKLQKKTVAKQAHKAVKRTIKKRRR
jgi:hypothetical protein